MKPPNDVELKSFPILDNSSLDNSFNQQQHVIFNEYFNDVHLIIKNNLSKLPSFIDKNSLVSAGFLGFLKSIEKFHQLGSDKFIYYLRLKVKYEILDELRAQDVLSRTVRVRHKKIQKITDILEQRLGREPTFQEISEETGLPCDVIQKTNFQYQATYQHPIDLIPEDCLQYELNDKVIIKKDLYQILNILIDSLPDRYQLFIREYYYESKSIKEIAALLNISLPRVCQLHNKIIKKLNSQFKEMLTCYDIRGLDI